MKILKHLFCMFLCLATLSTFVACGDEEDSGGGSNVYGQWVEQGNKLIYRESYNPGTNLGYTATWTLTFNNNNICVDSQCVYSCSSSALAQALYDAYGNDPTVTISGSTVTFDFTTDHAGLTKDQVMTIVESMGGLM